MNMKMMACCLGGLLLIVISSTGCRHDASCPDSGILPEDSFGAEVVTDSDCMPPCWEGLRPGDRVDSLVKIQEYLAAIPYVTGTRLDTRGSSVSWSYTATDGGHPVGGEVRIDESMRISSIRLSITYQYTLAELVNEIGEPDYVFIYTNLSPDAQFQPICHKVTLIWLEEGTTIRVGREYLDQELEEGLVRILPDLQIISVGFGVPVATVDEYFQGNSMPKSVANQFQPWPGYDIGLQPRSGLY